MNCLRLATSSVLATVLLAISGCTVKPKGPQYLPVQDATDTFPLPLPQQSGTAVGQCVKFGRDGKPILSRCPQHVAALFDTKFQESISATPIRHAWGVVRISGEAKVPGLSDFSGALLIASEEVIYDALAIDTWKAAVSTSDYEAIVNMCAVRAAAGFDALVVREYDGCSHSYDTGAASSAAPTWNMSFLAEQGHTHGVPVNFWTSDPTKAKPPSGASCSSKVALQVQVIGLDTLCNQRVTPLQLHQLDQSIQDLQRQLTKAQADLEEARSVVEKRSTEAEQSAARVRQLTEAKALDQKALKEALAQLDEAQKALRTAQATQAAIPASSAQDVKDSITKIITTAE